MHKTGKHIGLPCENNGIGISREIFNDIPQTQISALKTVPGGQSCSILKTLLKYFVGRFLTGRK